LQTSALPLGYAAGKLAMKDEGGRMKKSWQLSVYSFQAYRKV
jgi:hypothetical protein